MWSVCTGLVGVLYHHINTDNTSKPYIVKLLWYIELIVRFFPKKMFGGPKIGQKVEKCQFHLIGVKKGHINSRKKLKKVLKSEKKFHLFFFASKFSGSFLGGRRHRKMIEFQKSGSAMQIVLGQSPLSKKI